MRKRITEVLKESWETIEYKKELIGTPLLAYILTNHFYPDTFGAIFFPNYLETLKILVYLRLVTYVLSDRKS